ncbi:MAG: helix-turn-helix transcriptional regulator [Rubrivivax sp.]|nr:helix-turn-helix transcriptional regulator [Rubrivivax sp.]
MFETAERVQSTHKGPTGAARSAAPIALPIRYAGPNRRTLAGLLGPSLAGMLDEIDYGMLLVGADVQVLYLNHAARLEMDGEHPLQAGHGLHARRHEDAAPLAEALAAARRGLRRLLTLGAGAQRVSVSVVPLAAPSTAAGGASAGARATDAEPTTLLVLGKRRVCEQLSVRGFARSLKLTPAETRVLELLCAGVRPTQVAQQQGVAVSTVRTQIGSIRAKTGAASISELVRQVAVLPPLVGALRLGLGAAGTAAVAG